MHNSFKRRVTHSGGAAAAALAAVAAIGASLAVERALAAEAAAPTAENPNAAEAADASRATSGGKNGSAAATDKVRLAHIALEGGLPESSGQMSLFGDLGVDLRKTIARLDQARQDAAIAGIVLQIDAALPRGKLHELRCAVQRARAAGKKVYAYLESAEGSQYGLAATCDEVAMPESGMVAIPGVRAEFTFYKDLLSKVGIEADMLHCGDYKGAAEPYTRDRLSEPVRENMSELVDDLYDQMITEIAADRQLPAEQVRRLVDRGLLTAREAADAGLIDRVCYADEFRSHLATEYRAEQLVYVLNYAKSKIDADFSGPMGMMKMFQSVLGGPKSVNGKKGEKIAIVYAVGAIMPGKSEVSPFGEGSLGSTTLVEALRQASGDAEVKAVVLRIDSPGGSALASDLIWRAIETIDKPVVASMGDVAASGGYYIAMGADRIFAEPATVTGSIGVVGGKLSMEKLYRKAGVATEAISRGDNSGMFSATGAFTQGEREAYESMMQETYRQFTSKAAAGRRMPHEELLKLAGGRVYTGRAAKRLGLVDEIGDLHAAVAAAKRLAGMDPDAAAGILVLPKPENPLEALLGADVDAQKEAALESWIAPAAAIAPELRGPLRHALQLHRALREPAVLMLPYSIRIDD